MTKVHIFNTRLTEGGAADVALNLHNLLGTTNQYRAYYYYGYSFKGRKSHIDIGQNNYYKLTPNYVAYGNKIIHSIIGEDLINPPGLKFYLDSIKDDEIIHLHNIHHHIFNTAYFLNYLAK